MTNIWIDVKVPWGIHFLRLFSGGPRSPEKRLWIYRMAILFLTYVSYTCFHMSRKSISVVKTVLINCTIPENCTSFIDELNFQPEAEAKRLEGLLDTSFLVSYAAFMFVSGFVAERMNLRYYLSFGMIASGVFTFLFGLAYYLEIHSIAYFIVIQVAAGAFQSSGWPGVVTAVANWFGKGKKGLIFGIWNSHTSVGNILGSLLAGSFVDDEWGLSFIVPGVIIASFGFVIWLFLVPKPKFVDLNLDEMSATQARISRRSEDSRGELTPLLQSSDDEENEHVQGQDNSSFEPDSKTPSPEPQEAIEEQVQVPQEEEDEGSAISFWGALKIPGVVEFSLCLFFAKLVSYTFLYWLPTFIIDTGVDGKVSSETAANFSTLFDVGGIIGGIVAGLASDYTGKPASTCAVMLIAAIPCLFAYNTFGESCPLDSSIQNNCYYGNVGLLIVSGLLVNGPYALITTAVSAELGVHPSLEGSSKALATVTSIIDGTGSIGAAVGPFLAGAIEGLQNVFYMLMAADVVALLLLSRLVFYDVRRVLEARRQRQRGQLYDQHA